MKTRIGIVAGLLLFGVMGWAQPPADKAGDVARLKARLQLAELESEADQAIIKESILLLKRAERDLPLERHRSEREQKEQAERLVALKQFVDAEQDRFVARAVELEAARRELSKATAVSQTTGPARSAPQQSTEDADRLVREAEEAQLSANLLQAQLGLLERTVGDQVNPLAVLEVRAASDEGKGDVALAKELDAARKRYDKDRERYIDLKTKHAQAMRTVHRLQRSGMASAFQ